MLTKALHRFRTAGVRGVCDTLHRRLFGPAIHPINVALDLISDRPGFSVVQLGAFVGNTENDPLFATIRERLQRVNGKLIVVEPVKSFFDELVRNYDGCPGVACENVAISDHSGPATFYRLGVDPVAHGYPDWLSQVSSLKAERMTDLWDRYEADKKAQDFYLRHRVQETVQCITFSELAHRHGLTTLDLLQIDVEGYEFEILKTIDFGAFPVRFVNFESVLLHDEKPRTEKLMRTWGYLHVDYDQDTFCYRPSDKKHLTSRWSRRAVARGSA